MGAAVPPAAETRQMPRVAPLLKMITPLSFHDPPPGMFASQSVTGGPPPASILLRWLFAKKAIVRLSGDQKGNVESSVPDNGRAVNELRSRTQRWNLPSVFEMNAKWRPSGE